MTPAARDAEAPGPAVKAIASPGRILEGRSVVVAALVWGWAEATCFFIVPDVLLSGVACRRLRPALFGALAALAGALVGGVMMVAFGLAAPEAARALLDRVPGIGPSLIEGTRAELDARGLFAVLLGPS